MATDYLYAQSEVVSKTMPEFFGKFNLLSNLFAKGSVEMIGERDFRVPTVLTEAGRPGTYNPNAGAVGRGSGGTGTVQISTFFSHRYCVEMSELAISATDNVSALKAFKRAMSKSLPEFADYMDRVFHNDGTAVLGTAIAVGTWAAGAKTVYTMDTSRGVKGLRRGNYVVVYDTTNVTPYDSGAPRKIASIDYKNRKVYLDALVTSPVATDKLNFEGVSGASPAGPRGLQYFNSLATSGTTYGVDRSTELEMISNGFSLAGGVPTPQKGLQLIHEMLDRRKEMPSGLVWAIPPKQQANIYQQVLNYGVYDLAIGPVDKDLIPGANKEFKYAGQRAYLDLHQNDDRMDLIDTGSVLRARLEPVGFWSLPGDSNQRFMPLYDSTTGSPAAAVWFALSAHEDVMGINPGNLGVFTDAGLPVY